LRPALILALLLSLALSAGCEASGSGFLEPEPREAVFPLPERYLGAYTNDWGAPRSQGSHEGTDIFAPEGTPVRSITAGTVVDGEQSNEAGWNTLGGYTVSIRAANEVGPVKRGDLFYYAHLRRSSPLEPGDTVEAGGELGEAGATGNGPPGTREAGTPHLHLGWYTASGKDQQAQSGARDPYPLLERLARSGGSFTVQSDGPFS
jgi:collagen type III alpha